jgi:hypothetical protein
VVLLLLRFDRKKASRFEEHFPSSSSPVEDIESKSEESDSLGETRVVALEREQQVKHVSR